LYRSAADAASGYRWVPGGSLSWSSRGEVAGGEGSKRRTSRTAEPGGGGGRRWSSSPCRCAPPSPVRAVVAW
jgi:hypothetical protein